MHKVTGNLRESCVCSNCGSINRQRQIAYVVLYSENSNYKKVRSLRELVQLDGIVIYNTEADGPIHKGLVEKKNYFCSNYYGEQYKSGEIVNGVMHQDLMRLSFENGSIDLVLSSDVLEHVSDPYKAHREIYRVLKREGRHIFTVPFHSKGFADDKRAAVVDGKVVYFKEPIFHHDPLRPEGALVFTIFSLEMLVKLNSIGFMTNMYVLRIPQYGILGENAIVFEAIKR